MHLSVRELERRAKEEERKRQEEALRRLQEEELKKKKGKKVARDTKEVLRKKSLMDGKQVCTCIPTLLC